MLASSLSTLTVLDVLWISGLVALAAALGPLVLARVPSSAGRQRWLAASFALAAGCMLAASHLLAVRGLDDTPIAILLGAGLGLFYTYASKRFTGLDALEAEADEQLAADSAPTGGAARAERAADGDDRVLGYRLILQSVLHAAPEGVAIGVALLLEPRLGVLLAIAFALHNAGEGLGLALYLRRWGLSSAQSACLAAAVNLSQVLFAVAAFAIASSPGASAPAIAGFASGALLFLSVTELLPAAYDTADKTFVAVLVSVVAGVVVWLESVIV
ncbi:MAG: ZIP family metal transporter [Acidobacteriota bacterium]